MPQAVQASTERAELLRASSLILLDELPMLHGRYLSIISNVFQDLMDCSLPFGGKIILGGGDFRQIPPVAVNGTQGDGLAAGVKSSALWGHFQIVPLNIPMRDSADREWSEFVRQVKPGAIVSVLRNLSVSGGLLNGTKLIHSPSLAPAISSRPPS